MTGDRYLERIRASKQVGQVRPSGTSPVTLIRPAGGVKVAVHLIVISNQSGSSAVYSIYDDMDGAVADQTTALLYQITLSSHTTDWIETDAGVILDGDVGATLSAQTDVGSALTFTAYGTQVSR